jgi:hypothetical protein
LKYPSVVEKMKFMPDALTSDGFMLNDIDLQRTVDNSYRPWDNSFMNK